MEIKPAVQVTSTDKIIEKVGWQILGFLWILTIWSLFILLEISSFPVK